MNRPIPRHAASRFALLGAALLLTGACGSIARAPAITPEAPIPATSAPPSLAADPTAKATGATATQQPSAQPSPSDADDEAAPPAGVIALVDGSSVSGLQGSWCYDDECLDAGTMPTDMLPVVSIPAAGAELSFSLPGSHPFGHWRASYTADADDVDLQPLAAGGVYVDPDMSEPTAGPPMSEFVFSAPPSGDWRLIVHLQFADERGSTVYYWHAIVP